MTQFIAFPIPKYCERCSEEMPWRTADDICYACRVTAEDDAHADAIEQTCAVCQQPFIPEDAEPWCANGCRVEHPDYDPTPLGESR